MRMCETALFLLPVWNLTSPSCSSTLFTIWRDIPAIREHCRQKLAYLCLHRFSGPFGPKWRFLGQNRGRGDAMLTPQRTRSYFWGLFRRCHFWRKSIKKCDRESVDRQTDRRTHRVTETNWIHNLSHAICYSYVADNKLLKMEIKTCYMYYSLLVAFKSDVDTWNRRRR